MTLIPTGHFPDQAPGFNYEAAEAVHDTIMKMEPGAAQLFARMVVGGTVQHDLIVHEDELADAVREHLGRYGPEIRKSLTRSYLSKRADGEDITAVMAAAEVLSKAFGQFDYTPEERARRAHQQQRDLTTGRFVTAHHTINYALGHKAKAMSDAEAAALGIPVPKVSTKRGNPTLSNEQRLRYQTAYHQVAAALAPYRNADNAVVHLNYGPGNEVIEAVPPPGEDIKAVSPYKTLQSVSVSVLPSAADATTSPYDTLQALSSPLLALRPSEPGGEFNEDHSTATRMFRRLHAGSTLLDDTIGSKVGPQAQLALKVGQHVGVYGPEAQRVIGPTVDRAAYRYRGTEREPDRRVTEAFAAAARQAAGPADAVRADRAAQQTYEGKIAANHARHERALEAIKAARAGDTRSPEQREKDMHVAANRARQRGEKVPLGTPPPSTVDRSARITLTEAHRRRNLADGRLAAANKAARKEMHAERRANAKEGIRTVLRSNANARRIAIHGIETDAGWNPSALLSYFKTRLPSPELNNLQLKSGTVPPSEGVLLDRRGQMVTQAVGYGDDWYLPFNLTHLSKLRGGEYIRTRTWGGPTTEDLYAGLAAGAKSLTVVSHNGVYNIEFDPSFKGGRRYNDKAARMVGRYGHLLDTVRSGEVTNNAIDQSRRDEIETELEGEGFPVDSTEYNNELALRLKKETKSPTFSAAQRAGAATEFLDAEAMKQRTADGREATGTELVNDWLDHQANSAYIAHRDEQKAAAGEDFSIGEGRRPVALHGGAVAPKLSPAEFKAQVAAQAGLTSDDPGAFAENAITAMGLGDRFNAFVEREQRDYATSLAPLKLNGEGYLRGMQALQEQFPYYIASVSYHPWADAKRGVDTGYVNHGTNRPAAAEAGYFAAGAGAAGVNTKVAANSIRFQAGQLRPLAVGQNAKQQTAPSTTAGEGEAPAVAPAVGAAGMRRPLPADAQKALQRRADLAVLDDLWGQTHIAADVRDPGGVDVSSAAGATASDHIGLFAQLAPALRELRGTGDLNSWKQRLAAEPQRVHDLISAAVRQNGDLNVFNLDPKVVAEFHAGGIPVAAPRFNRGDPSAALQAIADDRPWGKTVYDQGANPNAQAVSAEYRSNPFISAAVRSIGLPRDVSDPQFEVAAQGALDTLNAHDAAYLDWVANGSIVGQAPAGHNRFPGQVEALARATQLRRRYQQATGRDGGGGAAGGGASPPSSPPPAAPPPSPPPPAAPVGFVPPSAARRGHLVAVA